MYVILFNMYFTVDCRVEYKRGLSLSPRNPGIMGEGLNSGVPCMEAREALLPELRNEKKRIQFE
jgi:hypothetical protein